MNLITTALNSVWQTRANALHDIKTKKNEREWVFLRRLPLRAVIKKERHDIRTNSI